MDNGRYSYVFVHQDVEAFWLLSRWPSILKGAVIEAQIHMSTLTVKFTEKLDHEKDLYI